MENGSAPSGPGRRNGLLAGSSSALFPGLGQFYNREWLKRTLFLGAEGLRIAAASFSQDPRIERNLLFLGVSLRLISCIEAAKTAQKSHNMTSLQR